MQWELLSGKELGRFESEGFTWVELHFDAERNLLIAEYYDGPGPNHLLITREEVMMEEARQRMTWVHTDIDFDPAVWADYQRRKQQQKIQEAPSSHTSNATALFKFEEKETAQ